MIALDTNVLARFLLKDDAVQHRAAAALLAGAQEFTAPPTVLLELVWVLEACDCTRSEILKGLRALLGLPNFKPAETDALAYALHWYEGGMDFADALHLALSAKADGFATFDRDLLKRAAKLGSFPPTVKP